MNFTENAKSKFWADLSAGVKKTFGHSLGEAFHIDQFKSGRFSFTESIVNGSGNVTRLMDSIKASSPVIESVRMTPITNGYNAIYNVSVAFDPIKAESVYSNGKTAMATVDMDGKKYVVDNDGNVVKQVADDKEADDFINNLNKSTKSNLKKEELENGNTQPVDEDGFPINLDDVIALANEALDGTGVSVSKEDDRLLLKGDSELLRPAQEYLPAPYYGSDAIEGGYNDATGDLEATIPDYPSCYDLEVLRKFLIDAVNCIIDNTLCNNGTCEDDEWVSAMAEAEPNESYVTKYGYKGESFVGSNKKEIATLIKSLMVENIDEARKVAGHFMGKEMVEGFVRKYSFVGKVAEKRNVILPDEMSALDRIHESAMGRAPEKRVDMESLVNKNLFNKEK